MPPAPAPIHSDRNRNDHRESQKEWLFRYNKVLRHSPVLSVLVIPTSQFPLCLSPPPCFLSCLSLKASINIEKGQTLYPSHHDYRTEHPVGRVVIRRERWCAGDSLQVIDQMTAPIPKITKIHNLSTYLLDETERREERNGNCHHYHPSLCNECLPCIPFPAFYTVTLLSKAPGMGNRKTVGGDILLINRYVMREKVPLWWFPPSRQLWTLGSTLVYKLQTIGWTERTCFEEQKPIKVIEKGPARVMDGGDDSTPAHGQSLDDSHHHKGRTCIKTYI